MRSTLRIFHELPVGHGNDSFTCLLTTLTNGFVEAAIVVLLMKKNSLWWDTFRSVCHKHSVRWFYSSLELNALVFIAFNTSTNTHTHTHILI